MEEKINSFISHKLNLNPNPVKNEYLKYRAEKFSIEIRSI